MLLTDKNLTNSVKTILHLYELNIATVCRVSNSHYATVISLFGGNTQGRISTDRGRVIKLVTFNLLKDRNCPLTLDELFSDDPLRALRTKMPPNAGAHSTQGERPQ